jgi:S-DNA-T family DNA segregation ATPase FtsK/SpoIIIE
VGKKSESLPSRVPVREKMKELGGLFFFLCATFVLISLVSFDPGDIREIKYPPNAPLANKGGAIGARTAYALLSGFGLGAYLLAFFAGFWSFMVFFRRRLEGLPVKLVSAAVSVFAAATLLSLQGVAGPASFGLAGTAPGLGGVYGEAFEIALVRHLGTAGAWLAVVLALAGSLVLSTDWMLYVGLLKAGRGAGVVLGRILHHYSAEERARRQEAVRLAQIEHGRVELSRRVATVRAADPAKVVPAPVLTETFPSKLALIRPPAPAPAPVRPPAPRPEPANVFKAEAAKYDGRKPGTYEQPPIDLFENKVEQIHGISEKEVQERMLVLEGALREYGVDGRVVNYEIGPAVTTYEVELAPGQEIHKVTARQEEITMRLSTLPVRVVAPLPGKGTVGIEVPNPFPNTVRIREFLEKGYADLRKVPLPMILGKTNGGEPILRSITPLPHLLIAGTTGSGKSVCLKSIITSLVISMSPEEMKLILIDPKQVELTAFTDIPHLWAPVVVDSKKAALVLDWLVKEMDERYTILNKVGVTSIDKFNKLGEAKVLDRLAEAGIPREEAQGFPVHMPYIVAVIDELADLMLTGKREVEHSIVRLSQKARAIGIHLVVATQRPSTDVITGLIRSNMPSRIAFRVPSQIESRIILDRKGAERLLGKGDMLVKMIDWFEPVRGQCTLVTDEELRGLVKYLRAMGKPEYHQELMEIKTIADAEGTEDDEQFDEAVRVVLSEGRGSTSLLQRALKVGYGRAARLIESMAKMGLVGGHNGSNARQILITLEEWDARKGQPAAR